MTAGSVSLHAVTLDCADPPALAVFWQWVVGGEVTVWQDGDAGLLGGAVPMVFVRVDDPTPGKNRVHLDLDVDDLDAAVERAVAAGPTRATDLYDGDRWSVLRDPEGNAFCMLRPRA